MLIGTAFGNFPNLITLWYTANNVSLPCVLDGIGDISTYPTNLSVLGIDMVGFHGNDARWRALKVGKYDCLVGLGLY